MPLGVARGMDGWKYKRRLSEVNARAASRGQNELVGKFKMATSDKVSIRGQVSYYYLERHQINVEIRFY